MEVCYSNLIIFCKFPKSFFVIILVQIAFYSLKYFRILIIDVSIYILVYKCWSYFN